MSCSGCSRLIGLQLECYVHFAADLLRAVRHMGHLSLNTVSIPSNLPRLQYIKKHVSSAPDTAHVEAMLNASAVLSCSHLLLCKVGGLLDSRFDVGGHRVGGVLDGLARLVSSLLDVRRGLHTFIRMRDCVVAAAGNEVQRREAWCGAQRKGARYCRMVLKTSITTATKSGILCFTLRAASGSLSMVSWAFITAGSTSSASSLRSTNIRFDA
jgi:hypothetical protein